MKELRKMTPFPSPYDTSVTRYNRSKMKESSLRSHNTQNASSNMNFKPPRWTELARRWVTWRIRPIRFNFVCLPAAGKFHLQQLDHCLHFPWILHWISRRSQVPMMQRAKQICLEPFTWSIIPFPRNVRCCAISHFASFHSLFISMYSLLLIWDKIVSSLFPSKERYEG